MQGRREKVDIPAERSPCSSAENGEIAVNECSAGSCLQNKSLAVMDFSDLLSTQVKSSNLPARFLLHQLADTRKRYTTPPLNRRYIFIAFAQLAEVALIRPINHVPCGTDRGADAKG